MPRDVGLTPENAGSINYPSSGTGGGYAIRELPEKYAGRPAPSQQWAGVPGDPSGSIAPPGSASATPPPRSQGSGNHLTGHMPTLDPGPPEQYSPPVFTTGGTRPMDQGEAVWEDPTDLEPTEETTGVGSHAVSGSDPPNEGCAAEVEYDEDPRSYKPPRDPHHVGDSRPKFGPGEPCAFNGGTATIIGRSTPVVARRPPTGGAGTDPYSVFSSTPVPFDHSGIARAARGA